MYTYAYGSICIHMHMDLYVLDPYVESYGSTYVRDQYMDRYISR